MSKLPGDVIDLKLSTLTAGDMNPVSGVYYHETDTAEGGFLVVIIFVAGVDHQANLVASVPMNMFSGEDVSITELSDNGVLHVPYEDGYAEEVGIKLVAIADWTNFTVGCQRDMCPCLDSFMEAIRDKCHDRDDMRDLFAEVTSATSFKCGKGLKVRSKERVMLTPSTPAPPNNRAALLS